MINLKSIEIEGFHNVRKVKYDLDQFNYFTGKNGSGKTTAMQAIQLALLGYIPGLAKHKSDIFKHAGSSSMKVTLHMIDNDSPVVVERLWSGLGSNINSEVRIDPELYDLSHILKDIELPIFNFSEFISLTANKLKDWFIQFLPTMSSEPIDWRSHMLSCIDSQLLDDNIFESEYSKFVNVLSTYKLSGVDEIRKANEYFKQGVSFTKSELDRQHKTIQSLIHYEDVDMDISDAEIENKLNYLNSCKAKLSEYILKKRHNDQIDSQVDVSLLEYDTVESIPEYVKGCENIGRLNDALAEIRTDDLELKITASEQTITSLKVRKASLQGVIDSKNICPFTKNPCGTLMSLISDYMMEIDDIDSKLADEEKILYNNRSEVVRLKALREELNEHKWETQRRLDRLNQRFDTNKKLMNQKYVITYVPDMNEENIDIQIKELNDIKIKRAANEKYNQLIQTLTEEVFRYTTALDYYKKWVTLTGVNGLQTNVSSNNPFTPLIETMNTMLHTAFDENTSVHFVLESKANSFSFGLIRSGEYVPYDMLSSGEKCLVAAILMTALVTLKNTELKLVMIDDMLDHLDVQNITKFVNSLCTMKDVQFIFAGVAKLPEDASINILTARN